MRTTLVAALAIGLSGSFAPTVGVGVVSIVLGVLSMAVLIEKYGLRA
jgi:hypothetical protein